MCDWKVIKRWNTFLQRVMLNVHDAIIIWIEYMGACVKLLHKILVQYEPWEVPVILYLSILKVIISNLKYRWYQERNFRFKNLIIISTSSHKQTINGLINKIETIMSY